MKRLVAWSEECPGRANLNSEMGNSVIADKIGDLAKSEVRVTQDLVKRLKAQNHNWDADEIRKRQDEFADIAYHQVWAF